VSRRKLTECDVTRLLRLYGPLPVDKLLFEVSGRLPTRFAPTGPTPREVWAEDVRREQGERGER